MVATLNAYGLPPYEDALIESVRDCVTVIVTVADVDGEYVESPASSARTLHVPPVALAVRVEPEIEQYRVPDSIV